MENILRGDQLILGTCYYPEHWPESLWEEDLRRMLDTGIEVIRIAEFAWSKTEPTEGNFTFGFYDRFLELTEKTGMKVIFCTPTATPPAWLTEKYPEVLNRTMDGVLYRHGARRHYNYNSPRYRELSAIITEKAASHYGPHPNVIGWQIDNELNCEKDVFYSESDTAAFRVFLKEKYRTLDALNEAWGTAFWNQTYTCWEEIHVPRTTLSNSTNPHEVLDYTRFISDSCCSYARLQGDIIKKYIKPGDFITTNGIFKNVDYQRMAKESLDFITYDSYPNFAYCLEVYQPDSLKDRAWSRNLAETRAISPVFGIMEQQSGANGWNTGMEAPAPRPGQLTLWTMQSIAHGADYVSYFRWRTCIMGTEIYWHGILDYSGRENRRIREVRDVHSKLQGMKEVAGSLYEARVGILKDYDNVWDAQLDAWHKRVEQASQNALFEAAQLSHTPFDYVYLTDELTPEGLKKYSVLFYPHPSIMTESRADLLKEYVAAGGTVVFGCRSGYKDMTGKCIMDLLPGRISSLTGTDILEYSFIAPDAGTVTVDWEGTAMEANVFTDLLEAAGDRAQTVGTYTSDYFAGQGALVCNSYGAGKAYYYGSAFTAKTAGTFLEKLGVANPYGDLVKAPSCCEIAMRVKDGKRFLFILNYRKEPAKVLLKREGRDLYTGETVKGESLLPEYGTMVLEV
ncbi:beta-galactosidase [Lachnospiraceae bacterium 54-53]